MIFSLFVLDLLGFGWGRVVRQGRGEVVWNWGVLLWVLGRSLGRGELSFVRRCGSNDLGVFDTILMMSLMMSKWILWRVSRVELLGI